MEISSCVDAVLPCSQEEALLHKIRSEMTHKSTSSDFSNPNYSHLLPQTPPPPPHISSLTAGNLPQCVSDAPYGPVGGQRSEKETDEDRGKKKEEEIHQLFSKGSEAMLLVSDYERVEELKGERGRLQSLDSGVGSGGEQVSQEEVSQESMEEVSQESMEEESITVPSLPSFTSLPSPPSLPSPLSLGFSEGLKPNLLERMSLMSSSRSVAPSGDGYMPVRQEQS